MVIDTSSLVAILDGEPDRRAFIEAIEAADSRHMSVATFVESSIVIEARHGAEGLRDLDRFAALASIELVPVDVEQAQIARGAFTRFGKGRHRAALNYGDCFSYALAIFLGEPLLCKGDDFKHTDLTLATPADLECSTGGWTTPFRSCAAYNGELGIFARETRGHPIQPHRQRPVAPPDICSNVPPLS